MRDEERREELRQLVQLVILILVMLVVAWPVLRFAMDGWTFFEFQKICREMRQNNGNTTCEMTKH